MNKMLSLLVLLAALIAAPYAFASDATQKDEAAIRAHLAGYAAARQKGDGEAQARFYTEDADVWDALSTEMVRGRKEIAKDLGLPPDPNRIFKLDPVQIVFLKPDIALADVIYSSPQPKGHAFYVFIKVKGRWGIRSVRMTRFPAKSAPVEGAAKN